ncbi:hypothetical protein MPTK1_1g10050 [Marchantia polymorpha subsp. ruderalis]|uniref:Uncharacterized protein n=2 Tax=Marchantia polymorpha TaxID=3197 RepID=A0AAF6ANH7_MARPO|nr:hypothetical protein MARPO_0014s0221 [Marchantia polymorpha]BBM97997.1 hypothetical protein Mp_1g10050 [Marchantia polymorpha subsp. ruderalis]|eukprot:PTQ45730.1 hypothetical protein MARPO_0014s0221 [Marchantia polymorpha]
MQSRGLGLDGADALCRFAPTVMIGTIAHAAGAKAIRSLVESVVTRGGYRPASQPAPHRIASPCHVPCPLPSPLPPPLAAQQSSESQPPLKASEMARGARSPRRRESKRAFHPSTPRTPSRGRDATARALGKGDGEEKKRCAGRQQTEEKNKC